MIYLYLWNLEVCCC